MKNIKYKAEANLINSEILQYQCYYARYVPVSFSGNCIMKREMMVGCLIGKKRMYYKLLIKNYLACLQHQH